MNNNSSNKWSLAWHHPLYILPIYLVSCSYAWAANTDTIIANGTVRTLENLSFENGTNGTFVIQAKNNADITTTNVELNSSGIRGGGAWIDNSKLTALGLQVDVTGNLGTGIYLANNSDAVINNLAITGQGSALGLVLDGSWSTPDGLSTALISEGTIATNSGDAVRINGGELALMNATVSTQGNSSYAVNVTQRQKSLLMADIIRLRGRLVMPFGLSRRIPLWRWTTQLLSLRAIVLLR